MKLKQETLEEAAKNWITKNSGIKSLLTPEFVRESFKAGAKWQQEQDKKLYSEEEVLILLLKFATYTITNADEDTRLSLDKWFEQFKKK